MGAVSAAASMPFRAQVTVLPRTRSSSRRRENLACFRAQAPSAGPESHPADIAATAMSSAPLPGRYRGSYPLVVPKWLARDSFFILLMVQFMRGAPVELDDSATIDGCGS